jgi:hypothetical protein
VSRPIIGFGDGLWRVEHRDICAGFIVQRGRITRCAPILRKHRWLRQFARRLPSA